MINTIFTGAELLSNLKIINATIMPCGFKKIK